MYWFFIATSKKKEGALHTDRPLFELPEKQRELPEHWNSMGQRRVKARYVCWWSSKKNYVTHDKSLASNVLSCDVQKKLPWRRFRSRPDRRGVPLLLLFTELFYGVSLFHYFAAWISKYVRAWCAEYNRASTSKKKASQKKCWNRDMIHWQNHIITLPHSLDLGFP